MKWRNEVLPIRVAVQGPSEEASCILPENEAAISGTDTTFPPIVSETQAYLSNMAQSLLTHMHFHILCSCIASILESSI